MWQFLVGFYLVGPVCIYAICWWFEGPQVLRYLNQGTQIQSNNQRHTVVPVRMLATMRVSMSSARRKAYKVNPHPTATSEESGSPSRRTKAVPTSVVTATARMLYTNASPISAVKRKLALRAKSTWRKRFHFHGRRALWSKGSRQISQVSR